MLDSALAFDRGIGRLGGVLLGAETAERVGKVPHGVCEQRHHLVRGIVWFYVHDFHLTHEVLRSVEHFVEVGRQRVDVLGVERR